MWAVVKGSSGLFLNNLVYEVPHGPNAGVMVDTICIFFP